MMKKQSGSGMINRMLVANPTENVKYLDSGPKNITPLKQMFHVKHF